MYINRQDGEHREDNVLLDVPLLSGILDAQDTEIIVADLDCNLLLVNKAAWHHLESEADLDLELARMNCNDGFSRMIPSLCRNCPNSKGSEPLQAEDYDIRDREGHCFSVRYNRIEWVDQSEGTAMFLRDVHEERTLLGRLNNIAYVDQLTGVPNRRKLQEDFDAIAESIEGGKTAGVLVIFDLDHFKAINDSYGHATGDVMLKRLTSHFENDDAYKGHVYRLGGDEFVLFYAESTEKLATQVDCMQYYDELLKRAFRAYTLPNIDMACTLSMGVSFFPWHGAQYSELLRKADIALYKAKESGRNTLVYFEEKDDTARKFRDMYIGIQPLLTREGYTFGYELVDQEYDRESEDDPINLHEFDRSIETLGIEELESDTWYFISFANQLLNRSVARNLRQNKFIVQVHLGSICTEEDVRKYSELHALGYTLSCSGLNKGNAIPVLFKLAAYCKFDVRETDDDFRRKVIEDNPQVHFIATQVDTMHAFEKALAMRYSLFQGYFFKEENLVQKTKEIDPLKANYLRLLQLTSTDDYVDFSEISALISSDVALSYKLLRLLNSAAVGLRNRITSISIAVAYLGEINLKQWIAMLALRGLSENKPMELIRLSLIRARFGESLSQDMTPIREPKHVFLVGLLSLLDVALERSKEDVFREIPVADEIRDSIQTNLGPHSDLLRFFNDYEFADWDAVAAFAAENQLSSDQINNAYMASVRWYNDLINVE